MTEPQPAPATPHYRVIRCPSCGNVAFRFVEVDGVRHRQCAGPASKSCGQTWDPGEIGREPR